MYRSIPVSNKILKKRWDDHLQALHHEKLRTMKPSIDSGKPSTIGIVKGRAKKEQIVEGEFHSDRYLEIERENRLLLDKMTNIMQTQTSKPNYNRNKKSLNKELRKRDLIKITLENQALLKRLTEKQASYNTGKWEGERQEIEKLLGNICEYPYQLGSSRPRGGSRELLAATGPRNTMRKTQSGSFKGKQLSPLQNKKSVFKRGVNIAGRYFIVEMTTDKIHVLELPYKDALHLMGSEDGFEALIAMFSFDGEGQLILKDTRSQNSLVASQSEKTLPKEYTPKVEKNGPKVTETKPQNREVVLEASSPKQEMSSDASPANQAPNPEESIKPRMQKPQQETSPPATNIRPASKEQPPAEEVEEVPESS